jgi:methanogenic corrinoid protein MtbC1
MAESIITHTTDALLRRIPYLRQPAPASKRIDVARVVEREVIPRLQDLPGRVSVPLGPLPEPLRVDADEFVRAAEPWQVPAEIGHRDVTLLVAALQKQDLEGAWCLVKAKHTAGVDALRIAMDLLGAAACELGELWNEDRVSFADVTLGTGYLHQLTRELFSSLDHASEVPGYHHRILLLPAPGDQHILGLSILGESFRRHGWDVCGGPSLDRSEPLDLIRREHFDMIGFSIGAEQWLEPLEADVERFRQRSRNSDITILVGGHAIERCPGLVGELGADGTVCDARAAPEAALRMLR